MAALQLSNLSQIGATAGSIPRLNLSDALQLQLPQLYADRSFAQQTRAVQLQQQAEATRTAQQNRSLALAEDAEQTRQSQQRGANLVSGAGTVGQLGLLGAMNWTKLKGAYDWLAGTGSTAPASAAGTAAGTTGAELSASVAGAGEIFGPEALAATDAIAASAAPAVAEGAAAALPSAAAAGPGLLASAAPSVGGAIGGYGFGKLSEFTASKLPIPRAAQRTVGGLGGAAAGFGTGAAIGSIVPGPGTLIGGIVGGIVGGLKGSSVCPIHSAAYGETSVEVQIARLFRDRYLTTGQLRAYYTAYEDMATRMTRDPAYRMHMRRTLIDPLIRYGAQRMHIAYQAPQPDDARIAREFLQELHTRGAALGPIRRRTGEVV